MMNLFLGLNPEILDQVEPKEKSSYRMVTWLFLIVVLVCFISNSYFGFLLLRTWWSALLIGLLMGFIHFSVLRISLITLLTKPLVEQTAKAYNAENPNPNPTELPAAKRFASNLKKNIVNCFSFITSFLKPSNLLRFAIVGLVALTISVPISTLPFHGRAMEIETNYRNNLVKDVQATKPYQSKQLLSSISIDKIEEGHFPFVVIRTLIQSSFFRFLIVLFSFLIFSPVLILSFLRYDKDFRYPELMRLNSKEQIAFDYQKTVEVSQVFLEKNHPTFTSRLADLSIFNDGPFNTEPKGLANRKFGNSTEFKNYILNI